MQKRKVTDDEIKIIQALYMTTSDNVIADIIGRYPSTVKSVRKRHGLLRDPFDPCRLPDPVPDNLPNATLTAFLSAKW